MEPASSVSSTRFALADIGREYVVFQPDDGEFRVDLPAGRYVAEWFSLTDRSWSSGDPVSVTEGEGTGFRSPGSGPCVLHLRTDET